MTGRGLIKAPAALMSGALYFKYRPGKFQRHFKENFQDE